MTDYKLDTSRGNTDEKEFQNRMAISAEGAVAGLMYAYETHDFGSLVDGAEETGIITVNGAELGDMVLASIDVDLQDMILTGYVQAADTVEYHLQNESGGTVDLASATVRVLVFDVTP